MADVNRINRFANVYKMATEDTDDFTVNLVSFDAKAVDAYGPYGDGDPLVIELSVEYGYATWYETYVICESKTDPFTDIDLPDEGRGEGHVPTVEFLRSIMVPVMVHADDLSDTSEEEANQAANKVFDKIIETHGDKINTILNTIKTMLPSTAPHQLRAEVPRFGW